MQNEINDDENQMKWNVLKLKKMKASDTYSQIYKSRNNWQIQNSYDIYLIIYLYIYTFI